MKYHKSQQRSSIDDLQSLVFSIWKMAGCDPFEPYGIVMLNSIKSGTLKSEVQVNIYDWICVYILIGTFQWKYVQTEYFWRKWINNFFSLYFRKTVNISSMKIFKKHSNPFVRKYWRSLFRITMQLREHWQLQ